MKITDELNYIEISLLTFNKGRAVTAFEFVDPLPHFAFPSFY